MSERARVFGVPVDVVDRREAIARLSRWLDEPQTGRYVVTPNVDHVCKLSQSAALRQAYERADLVVVDGTFVLWAARLLGVRLPCVITGSDLTPALLEEVSARNGVRVFLLGAAPGVADAAAAVIERRWSAVKVCGTCSPSPGFECDLAALAEIDAQIAASRPDVLIVGLGAPKQELWASSVRQSNPARVTLCVGATIDFLAGKVRRAPRWLRGTGFEWLHRLATEPRRLGPRYFRDALTFPRIVWREWRQRAASAHAPAARRGP